MNDMDTIESQKNIFSDLSLTITYSDFVFEHFCIFPQRVVEKIHSTTTGSRPSTAGSAAAGGAGGAGGSGAGGGSRCASAGSGVLGAGGGWNGGAGHVFFWA